MIQAAFDAGGLDAIYELFAKLEATITELQITSAKLRARTIELEKYFNKNSSDSSKLPSSDGLNRKSTSLRPQNTGRKPGNQPGHPGQTLLRRTPTIVYDSKNPTKTRLQSVSKPTPSSINRLTNKVSQDGSNKVSKPTYSGGCVPNAEKFYAS